jgi:hypothetical protein
MIEYEKALNYITSVAFPKHKIKLDKFNLMFEKALNCIKCFYFT